MLLYFQNKYWYLALYHSVLYKLLPSQSAMWSSSQSQEWPAISNHRPIRWTTAQSIGYWSEKRMRCLGKQMVMNRQERGRKLSYYLFQERQIFPMKTFHINIRFCKWVRRRKLIIFNAIITILKYESLHIFVGDWCIGGNICILIWLQSYHCHLLINVIKE